MRTDAGFLWALGGELISRLNEDEAEQRLSARELIPVGSGSSCKIY